MDDRPPDDGRAASASGADGVRPPSLEKPGNARGRRVYTFEFPGGVPQKIGMKIAVNMGVKDIEIPIRLRNLPLPPMPQDAG